MYEKTKRDRMNNLFFNPVADSRIAVGERQFLKEFIHTTAVTHMLQRDPVHAPPENFEI